MQTLADATRVRLLRLLESDELSVSELCSVVQLPQSTVSRHLKVLSADGWISNRRDGTNQLYSFAIAEYPQSKQELWQWVRNEADTPTTALDQERLAQVLAKRSRGEAFFQSAAQQWENLRTDLFGKQLDAYVLAASLSPSACVGEFGCGSAPISQIVAPHVREVIAVDNSDAMISAAEQKIKQHDNIRLLKEPLEETSISDQALDVAWMVVVLPYLSDPQAVLAEASRTLKVDAALVIVDLLPHERTGYQQEMGHVRLGVDRTELEQWIAPINLNLVSYQTLPPDPEAKGPALFAARLQRGK